MAQPSRLPVLLPAPAGRRRERLTDAMAVSSAARAWIRATVSTVRSVRILQSCGIWKHSDSGKLLVVRSVVSPTN